ncbi:MAG: pyruvate kinase [Saprospiraceae bacterium]
MSDRQNTWPCEREKLDLLIDRVGQLRSEIESYAGKATIPDGIHEKYRKSAINLVHYMAMRMMDVRELQLLLSEWGLSSIGRAERKVMATMDSLLEVLHKLKGQSWSPPQPPPVCHREGRQLLEDHTDQLLGEHPSGRRARIMVTMPDADSIDMGLIAELLDNGMDSARINTAQGSPDEWFRIIESIRKAESRTGRKCLILMDLAGPKLRTGEIEPGPEVIKVRPLKNELGQVVEPAMVWLYPEKVAPTPPAEAKACLPVNGGWIRKTLPGDVISFKDARGSRRQLAITTVNQSGALAALGKTAYFTSGMGLKLARNGEKIKAKKTYAIGQLPPLEGYIHLKTGDNIQLYRKPIIGKGEHFDENGLIQPARVSCSIPEVLEKATIGESVWFDDGKIEGSITGIEEDFITVSITNARPQGTKLRAHKGINLPDTEIDLPALTEEDKAILPFVIKQADIIGMSFVNRPADVDELIRLVNEECRSRGIEAPGIVLKIETRRAFDRLPSLLLSGMKAEKLGVMIARGDLAVECGFERLAEVQEQILWVCEAAHVPVIWATQVLEGLAKQGLPTRAEISDAALGQRAECIMLNKGEHIVEATRSLDDILRRMQDHQTKKRSLLRKLHLAEKFFVKS